MVGGYFDTKGTGDQFLRASLTRFFRPSTGRSIHSQVGGVGNKQGNICDASCNWSLRLGFFGGPLDESIKNCLLYMSAEAVAPVIISTSSPVMTAWRVLLYRIWFFWIISPAFLEAF